MSYTNLLGLWPRDISRPTKSEAERRAYDALYAWHSLKLRTKAKGEFSEADFIIADPNRLSLLILEVKGGQISQQDGHWYQNNLPLKEPPLDQAFNFRRQLIDRFKEDNVESSTIIFFRSRQQWDIFNVEDMPDFVDLCWV
jgi:hypothetical protein